MQEEEVLLALWALIRHGKFTHTRFVSFCKRILHLKVSYAKLNGLWWSEQPFDFSEMSGQLWAERSFDIRKMT